MKIRHEKSGQEKSGHANAPHGGWSNFPSLSIEVLALGLALGLGGACKKDGASAAPAEATPASGEGAVEAEPEAEAEEPASKPERTPAPEPEKPEHLTVGIFEDYLNQNMDDLLQCFTDARKRKPSLQGTLLANFAINADGKVTAVKAGAGSTFKDAKLFDCLKNKVNAWGLPKPPRGRTTNMEFPFDLSGAGEGDGGGEGGDVVDDG